MGTRLKDLELTSCIVLLTIVPQAGSEVALKQKVAAGQFRQVYEESRREEKWVLWKTDQGYVVEGELTSRDQYSLKPTLQGFQYVLDAQMRLLRYEIRTVEKDPWVAARVGCELGPGELRCWSESNEKRLSIGELYDIFPIFPWFAASVVHRVGDSRERNVAKLRLVLLDDDDPYDFVLMEGEVSGLPSETVSVAGQEFRASKYQIIATEPGTEFKDVITCWVSDEGIPLRLRYGDTLQPDVGADTELVEYERYWEPGSRK